MTLWNRQDALQAIRRRFGSDPPPLGLVFWDGERFDFTDSPVATLKFHSPQVLRALVTGNMTKLADAYVSGTLEVEGRIDDVIDIGIRIADRIGRIPLLRPALGVLAKIPRARTVGADTRNVRHHYDVGNDFYRLWLDRNMIYSCAYFHTGVETIDEAQEQKLDHICRKLRLEPGERLLDIGCGWGGLLRWAVLRYGVNGQGITLSEAQADYAAHCLEEDGLQGRAEVRLADYRHLAADESFDKIVSVGMYEHVGLENLSRYFRAAAGALRPGGIFLNHGIITTDPDGKAQGPAGSDFIDRYVFPGGALPNVSRVLREVARAGLEPVDVEDLRPHYARTLQLWSERLEAKAEAAIAAIGAERYRVWRVYIPGMARAFDRGWLSVVQVLAFKPTELGPAARPWTRRYQYGSTIE
jgi:cyclopropane-fatty-acyl-phospholipid synthase